MNHDHSNDGNSLESLTQYVFELLSTDSVEMVLLKSCAPASVFVASGWEVQSDGPIIEAEAVRHIVTQFIKAPQGARGGGLSSRQGLSSHWEAMVKETGVHFSCDLATLRLRISVLSSDSGAVMNVILRKTDPRPRDVMITGLPGVVVDHVTNLSSGLVVICGPSNSGKTTTMYSLLNNIATNRPMHISTLEDPIEIPMTSHGRSIWTQRQVQRDVATPRQAIADLLRMAPDIIALAEVRDREMAKMTLQLAPAGHLVFITMHASSTDAALRALLEFVDQEQRREARAALAASLACVIGQRLIVNKSGDRRLLACEYVIPSPSVRKMLSEDDSTRFAQFMRFQSEPGRTQSLTHSIVEMIRSGSISSEEGGRAAHDKDTFESARRANWVVPRA